MVLDVRDNLALHPQGLLATQPSSLLLRHLEEETGDLGSVAGPVRGLQQRLESSSRAKRGESSRDAGARTNGCGRGGTHPHERFFRTVCGVGQKAGESLWDMVAQMDGGGRHGTHL